MSEIDYGYDEYEDLLQKPVSRRKLIGAGAAATAAVAVPGVVARQTGFSPLKVFRKFLNREPRTSAPSVDTSPMTPEVQPQSEKTSFDSLSTKDTNQRQQMQESVSKPPAPDSAIAPSGDVSGKVNDTITVDEVTITSEKPESLADDDQVIATGSFQAKEYIPSPQAPDSATASHQAAIDTERNQAKVEVAKNENALDPEQKETTEAEVEVILSGKIEEQDSISASDTSKFEIAQPPEAVDTERNTAKVAVAKDENSIGSDEVSEYITSEFTAEDEEILNEKMHILATDKPLDAEELKKWLETISDQEAEMRPDTYYGTLLIPESLYSRFEKSTREDISSYLKRHAEVLDRLLIDAQTDVRFSLRRVIVIKDDAVTGEEVKTLPNRDSMGYSLLSDEEAMSTGEPYDSDWGINKLALQNWAKDFLHLPVQEPVAIDSPLHVTKPSNDIPEAWREFDPGKTDLTNDLTGDLHIRLGSYNRMLLRNRLKNRSIHRRVNGLDYPPVRPETVLFSFGEEFKDANFSLMHLTDTTLSNGQTGDALVESLSLLTDENGSVLVSGESLFESDLISQQDAVVLLKVNKDGKGYVNWLNLAQHANIASWLGMGDGVRMDMKLAGEDTERKDFDDTVEYSKHVVPEMDIEEVSRIDGMITYGSRRPFTRKKIDELVEKFNEMGFAVEPKTFFGTLFVNDATYREYPKLNGETFERMIGRHMERMNQMLHGAETPAQVNMRRIVVVDRSSQMPDLYLRELHLKDSDGGWGFRGRYALSEVGFHDSLYNTDNGLIHEWGHSLFHIGDQYIFNVEKQYINSEMVSDLPEGWQDYWAGRRQDISNDIMSAGEARVGVYTAMLLQKKCEERERKGRNPDIDADFHQFEGDLPESVTINFGEVAKGATFEVIRSCKSEKTDEKGFEFKKLKKVGEVVADENGRFQLNMEDVFKSSDVENERGYLHRQDGSVLLKATDSEGKVKFRWMDIRDFNIAHWKGFDQAVEMKMKLADGSIDQESYDWTVQYSKPTSESVATQ